MIRTRRLLIDQKVREITEYVRSMIETKANDALNALDEDLDERHLDMIAEEIQEKVINRLYHGEER